MSRAADTCSLKMPVVTRFAPSPTGYLHLGHAYAALFAEHAAREAGGRFLLRIEDIDRGRCRPAFEAAVYEDLDWLGLEWETPVVRQSERMTVYGQALEALDDQGLVYPCFCTRREIRDETARAGLAPHGPDGPIYPGTCRRLDPATRRQRIAAGEPYALRLDMAAALARSGDLAWTEQTADGGHRAVAATPGIFGDVVLARKDTPASYHLACTLDDDAQGVTLVTRGEDLFAATHVHRLLQALLGLGTPAYRHHRLLTSDDGMRLAKRHGAATLRSLRESGMAPAEVRRLAGF